MYSVVCPHSVYIPYLLRFPGLLVNSEIGSLSPSLYIYIDTYMISGL